MAPDDDSILARIITLALSRTAFSLPEALSYVGWEPERSDQMQSLLETFSKGNLDILRPLGGHRYAASARIWRKAGRATP